MGEVLYDVGNLAYVTADVRADENGDHRLHSALDVCEVGNVDRVARSSLRAVLEGVRSLGGHGSVAMLEMPHESAYTLGNGRIPESYKVELRCPPHHEAWCAEVGEALHEFVVASILADWLSITLPEGEGVWREKAGAALGRLAGSRPGCRHRVRRVSPL